MELESAARCVATWGLYLVAEIRCAVMSQSVRR